MYSPTDLWFFFSGDTTIEKVTTEIKGVFPIKGKHLFVCKSDPQATKNYRETVSKKQKQQKKWSTDLIQGIPTPEQGQRAHPALMRHTGVCRSIHDILKALFQPSFHHAFKTHIRYPLTMPCSSTGVLSHLTKRSTSTKEQRFTAQRQLSGWKGKEGRAYVKSQSTMWCRPHLFWEKPKGEDFDIHRYIFYNENIWISRSRLFVFRDSESDISSYCKTNMFNDEVSFLGTSRDGATF